MERQTPVLTYWTLGFLVALLLWTGLVFLRTPSLEGEFLYDDNPFIVRNPEVHHLDNPLRFFTSTKVYAISGDFKIYRPLASLSFALNYHFNRLDPLPYHLVNIVGHLVNAVLLFFLLRSILRSEPAAAFATLFFALHPRNVEAVVWIASRSNILFLLFFLAGFLCHLRAWRPGRAGFLYSTGSILAFALALSSKEMAITYPAVLVLYDWLLTPRSQRTSWTRRLVYYGLLAGVAVLYLITRTLVIQDVSQRSFHGGSFFLNLLYSVKIVASYVLMTFQPFRLSVVYPLAPVTTPFAPMFILSLVFMVGIVYAFFVTRKSAPLVSFGLGFFVLTILPVSQLVPIATTVNDRFLYLPMIGLAILPAWGLARLIPVTRLRRAWLVVLVIGALAPLGLFSFQTVRRSWDWKDFYTLFQSARKMYPTSGLPYAAAGLWHIDQGDTDKAIEELESYLRLENRAADSRAVMALAAAHVHKGNLQRAGELMRVLIRIQPDNAAAYLNLGVIYDQQGRRQEAIEAYRKAIEQDPDLGRAYFLLSIALDADGQTDQALSALRVGWERCPEDVSIAIQLGRLELRTGDPTRAVEVWRRSLELYPTSPDLLNNLAWVYVTEKPPLYQPQLGLQLIQDVVIRYPETPAYLSTLAAALEVNGRLEEAVQADERALSFLHPDDPARPEIQTHLDGMRKKIKP